MVLLIPFLAISQHQRHYTYDFVGSYDNFASLVDGISRRNIPGEQVQIRVPIPPETKAQLNIQTDDLSTFFSALSAQTPLRFLVKKSPGTRTWVLNWSSGTPEKGTVGLYYQSGTYYLKVSEATVKDISQQIYDLTGYEAIKDFRDAKIDEATVVKGLATGPRKLGDEETPKAFTTRLISEYQETVKKAAAPQPSPTEADTKRSVWTMTFLSGSPPAVTGANTNLGTGGLAIAEIATALSAIFPAPPKKEGDKVDPVPEVFIKPVSNTLVISGKAETVDEVRRLLATQIDVPQSQILIEMDSYEVSANLHSREFADRSVRKLMLGQQIARAYKLAHVQAIKDSLAELSTKIKENIEGRHGKTGIYVDRVFDSAGLDHNPDRALSQIDMMVLMLYSPAQELATTFKTNLAKRFGETSAFVQATLVMPLQNSTVDKDLGDSLAKLNADLSTPALLKRFPKITQSADGKSVNPPVEVVPSLMLAHFAANSKLNEQARETGENFMLLWTVSARKNLDTLLRLKPSDSPLVESVKRSLGTQSIKTILPAEDPNEKLDFYRVLVQIGLADPDVCLDIKRKVNTECSGDRAAKLTRVSAMLDDLLQGGVFAISHDSDSWIDKPLNTWIDQTVIGPSRNSMFGVRFGGTTKLAATSRVPGVTGAEADSFFPFQPTSPIDLTSLLPIIKRPSAANAAAAALPAGTAAAAPDQYALAGLSPQEAMILQGLFSQAGKQAVYRKLSTGLHMSVLPTMLASGNTARLQVKLSFSVTPDEAGNAAGAGSLEKPGPIDLLKSTVVETELLVNSFDIAQVSSLKLDVSAPGKRDWEVPILSQILPIRSWFVGPTQDKSVRHEAVVLMKITIIPKAMDLASRYLDGG